MSVSFTAHLGFQYMPWRLSTPAESLLPLGFVPIFYRLLISGLPAARKAFFRAQLIDITQCCDPTDQSLRRFASTWLTPPWSEPTWMLPYRGIMFPMTIGARVAVHN